MNYIQERDKLAEVAALWTDKRMNTFTKEDRMRFADIWNRTFHKRMYELCEENGLISSNWRLFSKYRS